MMIKVMHAFPEEKISQMNAHMKNWFGIVPLELEDPRDGSYMACYCGAWLVPMEYDDEANIKVGAVWHQRKYKDKNGE